KPSRSPRRCWPTIFGTSAESTMPKPFSEMVGQHLRGDLDGFLADHGLAIPDIATWICHPGGPKVLTAMEESFELPRDAFVLTWRSLAELGNLSSSSVLMVLGDTLEQRPPEPGSWGVLLAMGPGFCSELVLLRF
ncbi:MAG: 3-oxoacyl-[acyl-carrier-protein] synthase III C-terminal domain-containing protein, partial [Acidobacteriota bacterium]